MYLTRRTDKSVRPRINESSIAKNAECIFILDCSGSMGGMVEKRRKIDHLRAAAAKFPMIGRIVFSAMAYPSTIIPEPMSSTDMALAFETARMYSPKSVVLVTDGQPDSKHSAMESGLSLRCPINTIYIGLPGEEGEIFCKALSNATGGRAETASTASDVFSKTLTDGIKRLLPEHKEK